MTIQQAILNNSTEALAEQILRDSDQINECSPDGLWLPFWAARLGNLQVLDYIALHCAAAPMDRVDANGRGLLHYAAESDSVETVEYVARRLGISPLAADRYGVTPYALAQEKGGAVAAWFCREVGAMPAELYQNPVARGFRPDPSVVAHGQDFYMVNSSFVLFPCLPISHSRDLVHWQTIGYAITDDALARIKGLGPGCGYWAPDISFYHGKFYIVATLRLNGCGPRARVQMLTWSERPEGPYAPPVFLEEDGIDPSLFCDDDGRRYLLMNRGASIFEIGENGEKMSATRMLYYGDTRKKSEGPHLVKKDGWYYLFQAEGGTGENHRISVARSATLFGTYERCPYNPVLTQAPGEPYLHRCGHGKPFRTGAGRWYIAYLCSRKPQGYSLLGRETAIDPLTWTEDGWPIVNGGRGASALQKRPLPLWEPPCPAEPLPADDPRSGWLSVRGRPAGVCQTESGFNLTAAAGSDLDTGGTPCALLRRQTELAFAEQVCLTADTLHPGQNAGLTGYYDETSYYKFGVFGTPSGRRLMVIEHTPDGESVAADCPCPQGPVWLRVEADGLQRKCAFSQDNNAYTLVATLQNTTYLSDEGGVGKRFSGALHGIYAAGGSLALTVRFRGYAQSGDGPLSAGKARPKYR
jgi:xylan 1,4-beta-xylosidase